MGLVVFHDGQWSAQVTEPVAKEMYLAARRLALEVIRDGRISVECPHCHGTAAGILIEGDVVVGIQCAKFCGENAGLIFGREPKALR
jgi:hypothetical protein